MTGSRRGAASVPALRNACARSAAVFLRDTGHGLLEISHNTLALVGLAVVAGTVFVAGRADIRHAVETQALGWLQQRHGAVAATPAAGDGQATAVPEPGRIGPPAAELPAMAAELAAMAAVPLARDGDAVSRATAADPRELTRQQSAVAHWLARRYRVAPEPVSRLVKEAWQVAPRFGLDPTLILAVMAVESSFNPFAQSPVGAQGLMQVMTRVHNGKYERFGGSLAAFDPVTNLKVGVQVLKECIARAGSVEAGLRHYVGAANLPHDGGYADKVLAVQGYLRDVAGGKAVAPDVRPAPRATAVAAAPARRSAGAAPAVPAAPAPVSARDADTDPGPDVDIDRGAGAGGEVDIAPGAGSGGTAGAAA